GIALTCGPEIMMRFVARGLLQRGFSPGRVYLSMERRMKCGIAHCGHCQIGPKYVCQDGPVFTYRALRGLPDTLL
ncbi:MAG: Ni/Fe hydrogenase subunit gamma, partial [Dehalococcoidia bacterium]